MSGTIEEQLSEGGFYVTTTVGVSMKPMLRNRRDRVVIRPVEVERLSRLDVVLYRAPDGEKYLLHRIIGETEDGRYIIRGDNTYRREYVPHEKILGVLSEFYRGDRHILVTDRGYRRYAAIWNAIFPLRKLCHLPRFWGSKIKRRLKKQSAPTQNSNVTE